MGFSVRNRSQMFRKIQTLSGPDLGPRIDKKIFYLRKQTFTARMWWPVVPRFIKINQSFKPHIENLSEYTFLRKRMLIPAA
jgi:hypothetical protein